MEIYDLGYHSITKKQKFDKIEDEELVAFVQKDIDIFRSKCFWRCSMCGHTMSYLDSLAEMETPYVHEMKCTNMVENKRGDIIQCKTKMVLESPNNDTFKSEYFNELFARHNKTIMNEANFFDVNSDAFNEVYSALCLVFFKSVAMFARTGNMTKTSNKWFKSFLYMGMKHKMVDLRKTSSYVKRTPSVRCAVCEKEVGQITVKHLKSKDHEIIFDTMMENTGKTAMEESGEIFYFSGNPDALKKRAISIGLAHWESLVDKAQKEFFKERALKVYYQLYPNAYFKNTILSTNENLSDDGDFDIESQQSKAFSTDVACEDRMLDDLNINSAVDIIMEITFGKTGAVQSLNSYFDDSCNEEKQEDIIRQIVKDKISYTKLKNVESDRSYDGVSEGLTSAIFKMVKSDKECKKLIAERCLSR